MLVHKDSYNEKIPEFHCLVGRQGFDPSAKGGRRIYRNTVIPAKAGIFILYKDKKTSFHKI